jgi:hypothetical protein
MGFFSSLFGKKKKPTPKAPPSERIEFTYLIVDHDSEIPENQWYQKSTWKNKNFLNYRGTWSSDWKWAEVESKAKVAGISRGSRSADFMRLAFCDDFKMYLEEDPENPVDKNARKIIASATVEGKTVSAHIGYLPKEIAAFYAGVELDIRPDSVFLPPDGSINVGVKVALLERSARYLKKQATP